MHTVSLYGIEQYDLEAIEQVIMSHLPEREYRRIVIKPNWVVHEEKNELHPNEARLTHSTMIEAALRACLTKYPRAEKITVCDCPIQSCEWEKLCVQSGIGRLQEKYETSETPVVTFRDLRRDRRRVINGFLSKDTLGDQGDPLGYSIVELDGSSYLEEVSAEKGKFRVSDYDPNITVANHSKGVHRYCISNTVLDSDLFINLPKMKTHRRAGITGALKNIVGVNGDKGFLAHHREKTREFPADKFPPDVSAWVLLHEKIYKLFQRRSRALFGVSRWIWRHIKKAKKIVSIDEHKAASSDIMVFNPGSWFGNDTIWRMVYDINRILRYANKNGNLQADSQRDYIAVMDGIIAGEGAGPLHPTPVSAGVVLIGGDPFQVDMAAAQLMGFDIGKIPQLANHARFTGSDWAVQSPREVMVEDCRGGQRQWRKLTDLPLVKRFVPPPGWSGHVEMLLEKCGEYQ